MSGDVLEPEAAETPTVPLTVDLNADVGESFGRWGLGDDAALMPLLTSANIACGYHAGDPHVMRRTVELAMEHGVAIGAHFGLPDVVGFGRRRLAISPMELYDYIMYQSGALKAMIEAAGGRLTHVKPHGALFPMIQDDSHLADATARAAAALDRDVAVVMAGEEPARACRELGIRFVQEGYVDLDYSNDARLIMERIPRNPEAMAERAERLVTESKAIAIDGTEIDVLAQTICVHGDSPNARDIAAAIRQRFAELFVEVVSLGAPATPADAI